MSFLIWLQIHDLICFGVRLIKLSLFFFSSAITGNGGRVLFIKYVENTIFTVVFSSSVHLSRFSVKKSLSLVTYNMGLGYSLKKRQHSIATFLKSDDAQQSFLVCSIVATSSNVTSGNDKNFTSLQISVKTYIAFQRS